MGDLAVHLGPALSSSTPCRANRDELGTVTREQAPGVVSDHAPVADGDEVGPRADPIEREMIDHAADVLHAAGVLDVEEDDAASGRPGAFRLGRPRGNPLRELDLGGVEREVVGKRLRLRGARERDRCGRRDNGLVVLLQRLNGRGRSGSSRRRSAAPHPPAPLRRSFFGSVRHFDPVIAFPCCFAAAYHDFVVPTAPGPRRRRASTGRRTAAAGRRASVRCGAMSDPTEPSTAEVPSEADLLFAFVRRRYAERLTVRAGRAARSVTRGRSPRRSRCAAQCR